MNDRYILIDTTGKTEVIINDKGDSLQFAYDAIGCEYVELARIGNSFALLVDEEGLFKPDPQYNALASHLANTRIVGKAVLVRIEGEEIKGLTDKQIELEEWLPF